MVSLARLLIVSGCAVLGACDSRSTREAEQLARFPGGVIFTDLESPPPSIGRGVPNCLRATSPVIGRGVCVAMKEARPDGAHDAPRFGVWTYEYVTTTQGMSADGQTMTWYGDLEDTAIGLESQGEYLRDVPIGPWTFWHPNGRVRARGSFMAGEMSGPWWFFFDDGSVDATNTGVYQHDELTSPAAK